MFWFVGVPKRVYRFFHSSSERHSRRGMKTLGSRIPSVTSKNDKCERPVVGLKVVRATGRHPLYVHCEKCSMV
jgi:hypothetical protein